MSQVNIDVRDDVLPWKFCCIPTQDSHVRVEHPAVLPRYLFFYWHRL